MRRAAYLLKLSRRTVERKLLFLGLKAEFQLRAYNYKTKAAVKVEFDDLETIEHTKYKPLSVTLAVEATTRRILGIEVSRMPAKGLLARKAREMYGHRPDERREGRRRFFKKLRYIVGEDAHFRSDSNPYYPTDLKEFFPNSSHEQVLGVRGAVTGQGELKKTAFDPIFSLNHTCAMLRDNVKRLSRRSWCTTKKPENLRAHLMIYAAFHNEVLLSKP